MENRASENELVKSGKNEGKAPIMTNNVERKPPHWLEVVVVHIVAIGSMILVWLYAPLGFISKIMLGPLAMILILVAYGNLRPGPVPEDRKAWRRLVLKDGVWTIAIAAAIILAALAILFVEPLKSAVPQWLGIAALVSVFIGLLLIFQTLFDMPLDMIFPPKTVPPDLSSHSEEALRKNLEHEGVAKPRPAPNPDTTQSED